VRTLIDGLKKNTLPEFAATMPRETKSAAIGFQQSLKESKWDRALSYCSDAVKTKTAEYTSVETFFRDVLPIEEIISLPEFRVSGRSSRNDKVTRYWCEIRLSDHNSKYPLNWDLSVQRDKSNWVLNFPTKPLDIWLKHENLKMRYANEELKLDREKIRDGFKIRLIPLSNNFVIGRAMWFRLEMKNISNETLGYMHTSMMVNDPMIVKDPNGVRLPYIDRSYQTAVGREFVEPGETVLLADNYDVRSQYHIARPGSYTFQFRGTELLGIKPSNVVEARIKPGLLSPLEIVAEKLIPVLPQGWELTRTALPLEQFVEANTGEVIMVHLIGKRSGKGSGTSVFMAIFLGADYTKLELQGYLAELEFWGDCPWGPVYGKSTDAESLWPNYKEQIVNTLNIQMPPAYPSTSRIKVRRRCCCSIRPDSPMKGAADGRVLARSR